MKRFSIIAAVLFGLLGATAWGQTAIQPGTIVGTFNAQAYISDPAIFTVPEGKSARVTDIIITNFYSTYCTARIDFGPNPLYVNVPAYGSVVVPLNTGYGLLTGNTVDGVSQGPCPAGVPWVYVTIRGFYFTIP